MLLYPCTEKISYAISMENLVLLNMGEVKWFIVWNTGFVPLY